MSQDSTQIPIDPKLSLCLLKSLPGLYHPANLKSNDVHDWDSYSPIKINTKIRANFIQASSLAKQAVVDGIIKNSEDKRYLSDLFTLEDNLSNLYKVRLLKNLKKYYDIDKIHINDKAKFYEILKEGFKWTIAHLPTNQRFILVVEALLHYSKFIVEVNETDIGPNVSRDHMFYNYKSTDWIVNLFLNECSNSMEKKIKRIPEQMACLIESDFISDGNQLVEANINNTHTFVLFDDGAYSGQQKSIILMNFLKKIHLRKPSSTLIVTIPFYTHYAFDKFRQVITNYIEREDSYDEGSGVNKKVTVKKELLATFEKTHHHYEIKTIIKTETSKITKILGISIQSTIKPTIITEHISHIYIWTGGIVMEESSSIIEKNILNEITDYNEKQKQLLHMLRFMGFGGDYPNKYNMSTLGATLSLFEHKVPDYLSLNRVFGDRFEEHEGVKDHFKFNPPYKVRVDDFMDTYIYNFNKEGEDKKVEKHTKEELLRRMRTYFSLNGGTYIFVYKLLCVLHYFNDLKGTERPQFAAKNHFNFIGELGLEFGKEFDNHLDSKTVVLAQGDSGDYLLENVSILATGEHRKSNSPNARVTYIPDRRFPFVLRAVIKCYKKPMEVKNGSTPSQRRELEENMTVWLSIHITENHFYFHFFPSDRQKEALVFVPKHYQAAFSLFDKPKQMEFNLSNLLEGLDIQQLNLIKI